MAPTAEVRGPLKLSERLGHAFLENIRPEGACEVRFAVQSEPIHVHYNPPTLRSRHYKSDTTAESSRSADIFHYPESGSLQ